jgi:hypothetical protein
LALDNENLWKFLFRSVVPRALMIILAFFCLTSLALSPRRKKKNKEKDASTSNEGASTTSSLSASSSSGGGGGGGGHVQQSVNTALPVAQAVPARRTKVEGAQDICWDLHTLAISGVPVSEVPGVLQLANEIGANRRKIEPLCDPLTLLRFLRARDGVVKDALFMYQDTIKWRSQFRIDKVVSTFGDCSQYDNSNEKPGGCRLLDKEGNLPPWKFRRNPKTDDARLASRLSFFGMLDQPDNEQDGAPVNFQNLFDVFPLFIYVCIFANFLFNNTDFDLSV